MAFDEGLAQRIRELVQVRREITERKMFGGLAFMSDGHMFVGVLGDTLMARVGSAEYAGALAQRHVREMDFTGKPMKGYVYVDASGLEEESDLKHWVDTLRNATAGVLLLLYERLAASRSALIAGKRASLRRNERRSRGRTRHPSIISWKMIATPFGRVRCNPLDRLPFVGQPKVGRLCARGGLTRRPARPALALARFPFPSIDRRCVWRPPDRGAS